MSVKKQILSSSLWSITGTGATMLSSFVVFALMTRLLRPIDFGVVAFAALFIDVTRGLMCGPFSEALIRRKQWDDAAASTGFWMNLASAILSAAAVAAIGSSCAYAYGSVTLGDVFIVLSASLVVDALRGVHEAKLQREFGYRVLAIRAVFASVISGIAGILMALAGFGVWALVGNRLVASVLQTIIVTRTVSWSPKFVFSRAESAALFNFGANMVGARLLGQINVKVAELVIGFILGPVSLAFFRVGSRALNFLTQVAVAPIQNTAFSAFSRLHDARAVGQAYLRMTRATALVSFPVFFGAASIAPDFVAVCFGSHWKESGPIMAALALMVTPATLLYYSQPALASLGRTRLVLASNLGVCVLNALAAVVTVSFGPVAVAAGQSARAYITAPFALSILRRGIGVSIVQSLRSIMAPASAATVMMVVVIGVRLYALEDIPVSLRLVISVALGTIVYAGLLLIFGRGYTLGILLEVAPHLPPVAQRWANRLIAWLRNSVRQPVAG